MNFLKIKLSHVLDEQTLNRQIKLLFILTNFG